MNGGHEKGNKRLFTTNEHVSMNIENTVREKAAEIKNILQLITNDLTIPRATRMNMVIHATSLVCAIVAVQPIPFADLFVLTPIQVVMITNLSKIMGHPIGKEDAKEIIMYIVGVVGWGVLAQQVVLGLYKTILPYMGGFTTIPLVYGLTYSLGYTAKTLLEARQKDQQLTQTQIKQIAEEAKKAAIKEKDLTLAGLKKELDSMREQTKRFHEYKSAAERMEKELAEYKKARQKLDPEDIELFRNNFKKYIEIMRKRFANYKGFKFVDSIYPIIAQLSSNELHKFEEVLEKLREKPESLSINVVSSTLNEVYLEGTFRLYFSILDGTFYIYYLETEQNVRITETLKDIGYISPIQKNRHLEDEEIRQKLIEALTTAESEVDIVSPWISGCVINNNFIALMDATLKKGVTIKIVYGIKGDGKSGAKRNDYTDTMAINLCKRFEKYGNRFRMQKSNTHYKLLICDEKYYVQGSFNFLSFNGDYTIDTRKEGAEYSENKDMLLYLKKIYFCF